MLSTLHGKNEHEERKEEDLEVLAERKIFMRRSDAKTGEAGVWARPEDSRKGPIGAEARQVTVEDAIR